MKKQSDKSGQVNLNETLKKLASIVSWFENQSELDVEKGLEYVKEGALLIKSSRERLSEIEKVLLAHNTGLKDLYEKIKPLLMPPPVAPKRKMGFHT